VIPYLNSHICGSGYTVFVAYVYAAVAYMPGEMPMFCTLYMVIYAVQTVFTAYVPLLPICHMCLNKCMDAILMIASKYLLIESVCLFAHQQKACAIVRANNLIPSPGSSAGMPSDFGTC